jgi:hypothetical protein
VSCDGCSDEHVEDVILVEEPPRSPVRAYVLCPEAGRVRVSLRRLRLYAIDLGTLARLTAAALGIRSDPREVVAGRSWRVGATSLGDTTWGVYVAATAADAANGGEIGAGSLVLTVGTARVEGMRGDVRVVALADVARTDRRIEVDRALLDGLMRNAGGGSGPSLHPDQWYTHLEIAAARGLPAEVVRKRLERLRKKNSNVVREIANPPANTPKFQYQYGLVRHVLVKRAPRERPSDVRRKGARSRRGPRSPLV